MQLAQPVTFACTAPTLSERKYSQIRKKLLAQVFGMEHNHHHVYVQKVILWTDHNHLSPYCRSPWHQFAKDYSAYYCGFNNTTARYTTSLARRCCYLIPCQELIQRTMSDQPQNQRWNASTPLTSFLFQTTSSKNFREKRLVIQLYSFQRKQSWMASQVQRKNNQQPFTSTLKSEMSYQYMVV